MEESSLAYLVIGANGAVGQALCKRLRNRGALPILAGRNGVALAELSAALAAPYVVVDATEEASVSSCVDYAKSVYGKIDGVASCVGSMLLKPAHLTSSQEWHSILSTNLDSAFYAIKYGAKAMLGRGGSIALVSSSAAEVGLPNHEAIAAAKAGVEGLARSAAASYARQNITVNCVAPGLLLTNLSAAITRNPAQLQASVNMHPLGRIGQPEEIAAAIDWLLSADARWMTGQVVAVDGGLSRVRAKPVSSAER